MMQMHYFYEISESGLVSRTKGSAGLSRGAGCLYSPRIREGLFGETRIHSPVYFTVAGRRGAGLIRELPRRVLLGNA